MCKQTKRALTIMAILLPCTLLLAAILIVIGLTCGSAHAFPMGYDCGCACKCYDKECFPLSDWSSLWWYWPDKCNRSMVLGGGEPNVDASFAVLGFAHTEAVDGYYCPCSVVTGFERIQEGNDTIQPPYNPGDPPDDPQNPFWFEINYMQECGEGE